VLGGCGTHAYVDNTNFATSFTARQRQVAEIIEQFSRAVDTGLEVRRRRSKARSTLLLRDAS
jgi:hypothetical protein